MFNVKISKKPENFKTNHNIKINKFVFNFISEIITVRKNSRRNLPFENQ